MKEEMVNKSDIKAESGVYIARSQSGDVLYVGMSTNVEKRLTSSHHKWEVIKNAEFEIIPCPKEELFELEASIIKILEPIYNGKDVLRGETFILIKNASTNQLHPEYVRIKNLIKQKRHLRSHERANRLVREIFPELFENSAFSNFMDEMDNIMKDVINDSSII